MTTTEVRDLIRILFYRPNWNKTSILYKNMACLGGCRNKNCCAGPSPCTDQEFNSLYYLRNDPCRARLCCDKPPRIAYRPFVPYYDRYYGWKRGVRIGRVSTAQSDCPTSPMDCRLVNVRVLGRCCC